MCCDTQVMPSPDAVSFRQKPNPAAARREEATHYALICNELPLLLPSLGATIHTKDGGRPGVDAKRRIRVRTSRRLGVVGALALLATLVVGPAVNAGCCATTPKGNAVYNPNITDDEQCANLNGTITSQEGCAAAVGKGKLKVMEAEP